MCCLISTADQRGFPLSNSLCFVIPGPTVLAHISTGPLLRGAQQELCYCRVCYGRAMRLSSPGRDSPSASVAMRILPRFRVSRLIDDNSSSGPPISPSSYPGRMGVVQILDLDPTPAQEAGYPVREQRGGRPLSMGCWVDAERLRELPLTRHTMRLVRQNVKRTSSRRGTILRSTNYAALRVELGGRL